MLSVGSRFPRLLISSIISRYSLANRRMCTSLFTAAHKGFLLNLLRTRRRLSNPSHVITPDTIQLTNKIVDLHTDNRQKLLYYHNALYRCPRSLPWCSGLRFVAAVADICVSPHATKVPTYIQHMLDQSKNTFILAASLHKFSMYGNTFQRAPIDPPAIHASEGDR
jgi:hypothetical protein